MACESGFPVMSIGAVKQKGLTPLQLEYYFLWILSIGIEGFLEVFLWSFFFNGGFIRFSI